MPTFVDELVLPLHGENGSLLPIHEDALDCALAGGPAAARAYDRRRGRPLTARPDAAYGRGEGQRRIAMKRGALVPAAAENLSCRQRADMLYPVMSLGRAVHACMVVQRLTRDEKVIVASGHFEVALPLPARMFRFAAEAGDAMGDVAIRIPMG